jgi:hypothetical protein
VRDSLAQLLDSFAGKLALTQADDTNYAQAEDFNVCKETQFPRAAGRRSDIRADAAAVCGVRDTDISEGGFAGECTGAGCAYHRDDGLARGVRLAALFEVKAARIRLK